MRLKLLSLLVSAFVCGALSQEKMLIAAPADFATEELLDITTISDLNTTVFPLTSVHDRTVHIYQLIQYFKKLGYTHVYMPELQPTRGIEFRNTGNRYIYNNGTYTAGSLAELVKNFKKMTDQVGIKAIPVMQGLSHQEENAKYFDPRIAEIEACTGLQYIQFRKSDANSNPSVALCRIKITEASYFVVGYDNSVLLSNRPAWLRDNYDETDMEYAIDDGDVDQGNNKVHRLFICKDEKPVGEYELLGNGLSAGASMYTLFILPGRGNGTSNTITFPTNPGNKYSVATYTFPSSEFYGGGAVDKPLQFNNYPNKNDLAYYVNWLVFKKHYKLSSRPAHGFLAPLTSAESPLKQMYREQLEVIKRNWNGGEPEYINFACDEFTDWYSPDQSKIHIIKAGRSKLQTETPQRLIANHIRELFRLVDDVFDSEVKILLNADSFTPVMNGPARLHPSFRKPDPDPDAYTLCDDNYGILKMFNDNHSTFKSRLILCPWGYDWINTYSYADKRPQTKYLNDLGYQFIPIAGEAIYKNNEFNNSSIHTVTMHCTYEWAAEAAKYPNLCKGMCFATFIDPVIHQTLYRATNFNTPSTYYDRLQSCFTAPTIAYLFKYPYIASPYSTNPYSEDLPFGNYNLGTSLNTQRKFVFSGVDFIKSRNTLQWRYGEEYTIGLGIRSFVNGNQQGTDEADGRWENSYSSYRLYGKGAYQNIVNNNWNGSYAFAQLQDFDFKVNCASLSNSHDQGILIRQNIQGNISDVPYIYLYADNGGIRVCWNGPGDRSCSDIEQGYAKYLRATKQGNIVRVFSSTDGSNFFLGKEIDFLSGNVTVGMAMSPNSSTAQGEVLFTNVSISPNVPVFPLDQTHSKLTSSASINTYVWNESTGQITLGGNSQLNSNRDDIIYINSSRKDNFIADVRVDMIVSGLTGGLMLRQSLDPSAPAVYLCSYSPKMTAVYYRATAGANAQWIPSLFPSRPNEPVKLRLIRTGANIRALYSTDDGQSYAELTRMTLSTGPVYIGLCTTGNTGCDAKFSQYKIRPYDPMVPINALLLDDGPATP